MRCMFLSPTPLPSLTADPRVTRGRLGRAVPREHADRADTGLGSPHLGLDPETAGEPRRCYYAKP